MLAATRLLALLWVIWSTANLLFTMARLRRYCRRGEYDYYLYGRIIGWGVTDLIMSWGTFLIVSGSLEWYPRITLSTPVLILDIFFMIASTGRIIWARVMSYGLLNMSADQAYEEAVRRLVADTAQTASWLALALFKSPTHKEARELLRMLHQQHPDNLRLQDLARRFYL